MYKNIERKWLKSYTRHQFVFDRSIIFNQRACHRLINVKYFRTNRIFPEKFYLPPSPIFVNIITKPFIPNLFFFHPSNPNSAHIFTNQVALFIGANLEEQRKGWNRNCSHPLAISDAQSVIMNRGTRILAHGWTTSDTIINNMLLDFKT